MLEKLCLNGVGRGLQYAFDLGQRGDYKVTIRAFARLVFVKPYCFHAVIASTVYVCGYRIAYHADVLRFVFYDFEASVKKLFFGFEVSDFCRHEIALYILVEIGFNKSIFLLTERSVACNVQVVFARKILKQVFCSVNGNGSLRKPFVKKLFESVSVGAYAQHVEKGVESFFQKLVESQFFSFELLPQGKVVGMKYFAEFLRFLNTEKVASLAYTLVCALVKIQNRVVYVNKYRHTLRKERRGIFRARVFSGWTLCPRKRKR